ncbi:response regulator [Caldalkalibacillus mannanilyticus]|uniref:response regulator n=1 Tax=Caldalkalibacillus mannanilyticus TaxID=1418 RepID=UPI000B1C8625|nr:response regulator transcription factor [Caldalkalibacillus mannanilyticus]
MMEKIRVMIVEDDPIWLGSLTDFINKEEDLIVVGTASTKEEALTIYKEAKPEVVLLDINLTENNLDGIDIALDLTHLNPSTKLIMLTSLTEQEVIVDAFSVGALNYINKIHFEEIPEAIRSAYRNQSSIHPSAASALRNEFHRLKKEEQQNILTPAEKDILRLVHKGNTQSQIAKQLFITQRTIKNHVNRILKKLGVSSSKDAAEKASKRDLL